MRRKETIREGAKLYGGGTRGETPAMSSTETFSSRNWSLTVSESEVRAETEVNKREERTSGRNCEGRVDGRASRDAF